MTGQSFIFLQGLLYGLKKEEALYNLSKIIHDLDKRNNFDLVLTLDPFGDDTLPVSCKEL